MKNDANNPVAAQSGHDLSPDRYKTMLDAVDGIVWEADAETFEFTFVSDSASRILGYTAEEWLGTPHFWVEHIYQPDRQHAINYCRFETAHARNHRFEYRMVKADGNIVWIKDVVTVVMEAGKPRWLRGIMVDITESKLLTDFDYLEKKVLELNARKDTDIKTVLTKYLIGIEGLFPKIKCSVLRVEEGKIYNWVSPSLPKTYTLAINEIAIGMNAGSCGAAAYLKQKVIVSDIEQSEIWADFKHLAVSAGIRACWSYPLMDSEDNVMATFAVYYNKVMVPTAHELAIVKRAVAILKIILENRLYAQKMKENNTLVSQGEALASLGTWQWDVKTNTLKWSDVLYSIYGVNKKEYKPSFEGYLERVHPHDRLFVQQLIQNALVAGSDMVFEERIVTPDGQVKHLKSWAKVLADERGETVKMIGACLDITQAKTMENKMDKIAWLQSHVIRAPLARIMGLVYVLQEEHKSNVEWKELLDAIIASSHELDEVIRKISDNARL